MRGKHVFYMGKLISLWCILLCLLVACSSDDGELHEAPVFKSSTPANGASDVSVDTAIEVVFDEVITLAGQYDISINGNAANVKASLTKLVFTEILKEKTTYTITITKGAIINTFGIALEQEIVISFTTESNEVNITGNLVTENPSVQAVKLYNFLKENYGTNIVSAAQANVAWNINEAEWVNQHTNKYPAMATFDYIHLPYSPANWIDYSNIDFIKDWWNNNGIIAASWHWLVPPTESETDPFNYTYKESTTFKASNISVEGTWENAVAKADLDKLATYLKLLQDNDIPIIWRPLHEAAGNIYEFNNGKAWFWWGTDGAEAYKTLWKFMFSHFKEKGINNLIWVWTTQTKDDAFYPGDEYVDIIGRDIYSNSDAVDIAAQFTSIQKAYPNKMITLSECGSVANISNQWNSNAKWSYFMPWYDYDRTNDINNANFSGTDHQHANAAWWNDALNQENVITRDEMPSLK